jgi:hypothetical protein
MLLDYTLAFVAGALWSYVILETTITIFKTLSNRAFIAVSAVSVFTVFIPVACTKSLINLSRDTDAGNTIFVVNPDAQPSSVVFTDAEAGTITATVTTHPPIDTTVDCLEIDMTTEADEIVIRH